MNLITISRTVRAAIKALLRQLLGRTIDHRQSLPDSLAKTTVIHARLAALRVLLGADRVALFQFHNAGTFFNNMPRWNIACTHEVDGPGIASAPATPPILASRLLDLVSPLFDRRIRECHVGESGLRDCSICNAGCRRQVAAMEHGYSKSVVAGQGVVSSIQAPVLDEAGFVAGYIAVDFCSAGREDGQVEQWQMDSLVDLARAVEQLLRGSVGEGARTYA